MTRMKRIGSVDDRKKKVVRKGVRKSIKKGMRVTTVPSVTAVSALRMEAFSTQTDIDRLIASMNLDEMLEASKSVDMFLRGEKIPVAKSTKVKRYVDTAVLLCRGPSKKPKAEKLQQALAVQIVKQNKKTANLEEGRRLYYALMEGGGN